MSWEREKRVAACESSMGKDEKIIMNIHMSYMCETNVCVLFLLSQRVEFFTYKSCVLEMDL